MRVVPSRFIPVQFTCRTLGGKHCLSLLLSLSLSLTKPVSQRHRDLTERDHMHLFRLSGLLSVSHSGREQAVHSPLQLASVPLICACVRVSVPLCPSLCLQSHGRRYRAPSTTCSSTHQHYTTDNNTFATSFSALPSRRQPHRQACLLSHWLPSLTLSLPPASFSPLIGGGEAVGGASCVIQGAV